MSHDQIVRIERSALEKIFRSVLVAIGGGFPVIPRLTMANAFRSRFVISNPSVIQWFPGHMAKGKIVRRMGDSFDFCAQDCSKL